VFLKLFDHLNGIVFVFLLQLSRIIYREKTAQFKYMINTVLKLQTSFLAATLVLTEILKIIKK